MKKIMFCIFACFLMLTSYVICDKMISGKEILEKIDANEYSESRVIVSTMIVHGRRNTREIKSKSWIVGDEKSFSEYLSPPREKGTKMLKLEDKLWIYSPDTDRIIQISGHMLKQSVMGSDFSYEDMMEDKKLSEIYEAEIIGQDKLFDRPCCILELEGMQENLSYPKRKLYVDKERFVILKDEMYGKSGKLLKRAEITEVMKLKDRWYPKKMTYKDVLKSGKGTEFILNSIELDVDIPSYIFSKAALRK